MAMAEVLEPIGMEKEHDFVSDRDKERAYEIELFRAFMAGNRQAFTELYLRFRQRVYSYCLRMLGSSAEADDLYQEVFIRVYQRANQFAEDKSLAGWIFTIAHNLCLNRIRDRKTFDNIDDMRYLAAPSVDVGDDWAARIQTALNEVPEENREPFLLFEYQGLSYAEIAEVMKLSVPAVKSRIYRSRELLRTLLEPYYREE
jgi:RNA polymerase sigma-70 factor (ECF subfamily)